MNAYDSNYLFGAMANLGEMADYAVNACNLYLDDFWDLFLVTGFADQFGAGVPKIVAGLSGTELVWEVMKKAGDDREFPEPRTDYDCSPEYWCGWIMAYYQWYTGRSFKNIRRQISMEEVMKLYPTLHEASEDKFVDTLDHRFRRAQAPTRLKELRTAAAYSQRQLAKKSGVTLRSIQEYEQRNKNINHAGGTTLSALARTLGCRIEDLFEYDAEEVE
jgi:DNA-binding XRE family transcriptional regulator